MASDPALIGRVVAGRFRIVSFVGEGAMAVVYRAEQEQEPHDVAIKVMHRELARDETFLRRFRREAKAAARLSHPGVVRIVDYGVDEGLAYIAMELLTGVDLFELVAREKRLPAERAARILAQVCEPLLAAHERGILHRDLKPENVMLVADPETGEERVKVLDFGIAKILERQSPPIEDAQTSVTGTGLTTVGSVLGTPEYMSPEQCQGHRLDFRTDIYAAGVLLYQLVTGHVPFSGESPVHTMLSHVRDRPRPPSALVPGLHPALERLILRMLAKQPDERPQTVRELHEALATVVARLSPKGPAVAPLPAPTPLEPDAAAGAQEAAAAPAAAPAREPVAAPGVRTVPVPPRPSPGVGRRTSRPPGVVVGTEPTAPLFAVDGPPRGSPSPPVATASGAAVGKPPQIADPASAVTELASAPLLEPMVVPIAPAAAGAPPTAPSAVPFEAVAAAPPIAGRLADPASAETGPARPASIEPAQPQPAASAAPSAAPADAGSAQFPPPVPLHRPSFPPGVLPPVALGPGPAAAAVVPAPGRVPSGAAPAAVAPRAHSDGPPPLAPRSLMVYAVTFAVVFVVVLTALTLVVFR